MYPVKKNFFFWGGGGASPQSIAGKICFGVLEPPGPSRTAYDCDGRCGRSKNASKLTLIATRETVRPVFEQANCPVPLAQGLQFATWERGAAAI